MLLSNSSKSLEILSTLLAFSVWIHELDNIVNTDYVKKFDLIQNKTKENIVYRFWIGRLVNVTLLEVYSYKIFLFSLAKGLI